MAAYCPGTGAAALGQGNFDAIAMMVGMVGGSYLFAEASGWIGKKIDPIGNQGKITLHNWIPGNRTAVVAGSVVVIALVIVAIELLAIR